MNKRSILNLPITSEASIKNGIWFVFQDESDIIRFWGNFSGKEKVYYNDKEVATGMSVKLKSYYNFKGKDGDQYELQIVTVGLLSATIECTFLKNGLIIGKAISEYIKPRNLTLKKLLPILLASLLFGFIYSMMHLAEFTLIVFFALLTAFYFFKRDHGSFKITEQL